MGGAHLHDPSHAFHQLQVEARLMQPRHAAQSLAQLRLLAADEVEAPVHHKLHQLVRGISEGQDAANGGHAAGKQAGGQAGGDGRQAALQRKLRSAWTDRKLITGHTSGW